MLAKIIYNSGSQFTYLLILTYFNFKLYFNYGWFLVILKWQMTRMTDVILKWFDII